MCAGWGALLARSRLAWQVQGQARQTCVSGPNLPCAAHQVRHRQQPEAAAGAGQSALHAPRRFQPIGCLALELLQRRAGLVQVGADEHAQS